MEHSHSGAGPYPPNVVPVARPGDVIRLIPSGELWEVTAFVPVPQVRVLSTAVNEGITVPSNDSQQEELTELEAPDEQLNQLRIVAPGDDIPDGIEINVDFGGQQATFFQTKNREAFIDHTVGTQTGYDETSSSGFVTDEVQTQFVEFYIFEDTVPYFTFDNTTGSSINVEDIVFSGFRFQLTSVTTPESQLATDPIPLPTEAIPSGR